MSTADILHSPQKLSSQQLRKIKKPIIEKRRRERINDSLNQLKALVLEALNKDESQYNKMEKADILEMTVKHLKNLQTRLSKNTTVPQTNLVNRYKVGYKECAEEVSRYLNSVPNVHPQVKTHLGEHLTNCAHKFENCTKDAPSLDTQSKDYSNSQELSPNAIHVTAARPTNSVHGQLLNGIQVGLPVTVNGGQPVMLAAGPISPVNSSQGFVPVIISPNSNMSVMTSNLHDQMQTSSSPLPGNIIPLYSHSKNYCRSPDSPSSSVTSMQSVNNDTSQELYNVPFTQQQKQQVTCKSTYTTRSPSSPIKAEDAPSQSQYSSLPEGSVIPRISPQTVSMHCVKAGDRKPYDHQHSPPSEYTTLKNMKCSWTDYNKNMHKYNHNQDRPQQLVQYTSESDVWRPW